MHLETAIIHYGKHLIPHALRPWLRSTYIKCRFWIDDRSERLRLAWYTARGGSFLDWYARRLDTSQTRHAGPINLDYVHDAGTDDLEILKHFGLKPKHRLHEFGVGYLRSGARFIEYLDIEKFSANDIAQMRLDAGLDHFGREKLLAKKPNLIVNHDNSFDWLKGDTVDYIWCNAVLAHMPPNDIIDFFRNVGKIMHQDTIALITYSEIDVTKWRNEGPWEGQALAIREFCSAHKDESVANRTVKDFYYSFAFMHGAAAQGGLSISDASDLLPPMDKTPFQRWDMLMKIIKNR